MSLNWRDWPVPHHSSAALLAELVERFEYREDDILVNTYPKCGTTLTQEIVSCLSLGREVTKNTDLKLRSPFLDLSPPPRVLDGSDGRPIDTAVGLASPRVMKTHLPPAYHLRQLEQTWAPTSAGGPRNIIVMRNPKDAIVSAYHHMTSGMKSLPGVSQNFSQFWRQQLLPTSLSNVESQPAAMVHSFFDFNLSWWSMRNHPRVLILFYEDLIENKVAQVKKIAKFLGINLTEDLLESVLEQTSFETMRLNPNVNISLSAPQLWRPGTSFIRRGEIGDWKRHFTVAESEIVDQLIAERLAGSGWASVMSRDFYP